MPHSVTVTVLLPNCGYSACVKVLIISLRSGMFSTATCGPPTEPIVIVVWGVRCHK
jgi:hypothetical protein